MSSTIPAYLAIQFKPTTGDDSGWYATGAGFQTAGLPTDTNASIAPPDKTSYSALRSFNAKVARKFEGSTSGGGPMTTERSEHEEVAIERLVDNVTPALFQYCCNGKQLAWVHIVQLTEDGEDVAVHIRLKDVFVTEFECEGLRRFKDTFSSTSKVWTTSMLDTERVERCRLRSTVRYVETEGGSYGWNAQTDSSA